MSCEKKENIKEAAAAAEERRVDFSPFSSRVQLDAEDHKTCGVYCGLVLWTTDQTKKTNKKGPLKKNKTQRTNFNSPNSHNFSNLN